MCKATEYVDNINNQIVDANQYYDELKKDLRNIEKARIDIEHDMENCDNLDMYSGWILYKKMNKIRHARRKIKNELETMGLLINQLNKIKIERERISSINKRLKSQVKNKSYIHKILNPNTNIDNFINNLNNRSFQEINKKSNVYNVSSKLPKDKGSTIQILYQNEQQKQHIINKISFMYNDYCIDNDNNVVKLIKRK